MPTESEELRERIKRNLQITACIEQSHYNELATDIDESINERMRELRDDPLNKEKQYKVDDLVALRDELFGKLDVCSKMR